MAETNKLNEMAERIRDLRDKETEASNAKKIITQELENLEQAFIDQLVEAGLPNYRAPVGLLSVTSKQWVKLPSVPSDVEKLAEYAKSVGKYMQIFKPNAMSLNSFYKEEFEAAKERGDEDFRIPGIPDENVTFKPSLSFRKV